MVKVFIFFLGIKCESRKVAGNIKNKIVVNFSLMVFQIGNAMSILRAQDCFSEFSPLDGGSSSLGLTRGGSTPMEIASGRPYFSMLRFCFHLTKERVRRKNCWTIGACEVWLGWARWKRNNFSAAEH